MVSKKKYNKKEKELFIIKENKKKEEREKPQKETVLEDYEKYLGCLPDDVQLYIWEFVGTNGRLNFLRKIYTPKFVSNKLSLLPNDNLTIKMLYSCLKYVKQIFIQLNKGGFYHDFSIYLEDPLNYFLRPLHPLNKYFYFDKLISIISECIKNFSKIYKLTTNKKVIQERELVMMKLFTRIYTLL